MSNRDHCDRSIKSNAIISGMNKYYHLNNAITPITRNNEKSTSPIAQPGMASRAAIGCVRWEGILATGNAMIPIINSNAIIPIKGKIKGPPLPWCIPAWPE